MHNKIVFDNITNEFENNIITDNELVDTLRKWKATYGIDSRFINCILKMYDIPVQFQKT